MHVTEWNCEAPRCRKTTPKSKAAKAGGRPANLAELSHSYGEEKEGEEEEGGKVGHSCPKGGERRRRRHSCWNKKAAFDELSLFGFLPLPSCKQSNKVVFKQRRHFEKKPLHFI